MDRPFLIEEILLEEVSGEVRGRVQFDPWDGVIDEVCCDSFLFRHDKNDHPIVLDPTQVAIARSMVERVMELEPDLANGSGRIVASAASISERTAVSTGTRALADYLRSPAIARREPVANQGGLEARRRAQ